MTTPPLKAGTEREMKAKMQRETLMEQPNTRKRGTAGQRGCERDI